jgi:hypothetical protein
VLHQATVSLILLSHKQTTSLAIICSSLHITVPIAPPQTNKHVSQPLNQINHTPSMEAIKNAIGLGSTPTTTSEQQGREPVNGVTGSGVGGEPYDQGNAEGMHLP